MYHNDDDEKVIKGATADALALEAMKDVISCDKLRVAAICFDP